MQIADAYIKSGNVLLDTNAVWAAVPDFPEISIPAVVGDRVEITADFMYSPNGSFLDLAVIVGSSIVRYMASGTSTPAAEGAPAYYLQPGTFRTASGDKGFTVEAGHLDGGNVRFVLAAKSDGTGTVYASTDYPFYWRVKNYGPAE